jgi:hypothetical protein
LPNPPGIVSLHALLLQLQPEEGTASMDWRIKSINHRTTPARERKQTCATEAEFERAVRYALDWTRLISATLPDGTVLDASELRRRYGPPTWTPASHLKVG